MDFRTLARRDLQSLCKKNRIPANTTNLAMADALQALRSVEGIEEFLPKKPNLDVSENRDQQASPLPRARRVSAKASDVMSMVFEKEETVDVIKNDIKEAVSPEKKAPCTLRKAVTRKAAVSAESGEQLLSPPPCARRNASKESDEVIRGTVGQSTRRRAGERREAAEGTIENPVEITDTPVPKTGRKATARKTAMSVVAVEDNKEVSRMTRTRRTRQSAKVDDVVVSTRMSTRGKISKMGNLASEEEQQAEKEIGEDEITNVAVENLAEEISDVKSGESMGKLSEESLKNVIESDGVPNEVAASEESPEGNNGNSLVSELSEENKEDVGSVSEIGDVEITNVAVEEPVVAISEEKSCELTEDPDEVPNEVAVSEESLEMIDDASLISELPEENKEEAGSVPEIGDVCITNVDVAEPVDAVSDEMSCELLENLTEICSKKSEKSVEDSGEVPNKVVADEVAVCGESMEMIDDASSMPELSEENNEEVGSAPEIGDVGVTNVAAEGPVDAISDDKSCELSKNLPEICFEQSQEHVEDSVEVPNEVAASEVAVGEESLEMIDDASSMSELSEENKEEVGSVPEIEDAISDDNSYDLSENLPDLSENLPEICPKQPQENVEYSDEVPNKVAVSEEQLETIHDASLISELLEENKKEVGNVPENRDVEITDAAVKEPVDAISDDNLRELSEIILEISPNQQENVEDSDIAANEEFLKMNDYAASISELSEENKKEETSAPDANVIIEVPGEKPFNFTENYIFYGVLSEEKSTECDGTDEQILSSDDSEDIVVIEENNEESIWGLISDFKGLEINGGVSDVQSKTAEVTTFNDICNVSFLDQHGSSMTNAPHDTEEQAEILAMEPMEDALQPSVETSLEMANVNDNTKRLYSDADKDALEPSVETSLEMVETSLEMANVNDASFTTAAIGDLTNGSEASDAKRLYSDAYVSAGKAPNTGITCTRPYSKFCCI